MPHDQKNVEQVSPGLDGRGKGPGWGHSQASPQAGGVQVFNECEVLTVGTWRITAVITYIFLPTLLIKSQTDVTTI